MRYQAKLLLLCGGSEKEGTDPRPTWCHFATTAQKKKKEEMKEGQPIKEEDMGRGLDMSAS